MLRLLKAKTDGMVLTRESEIGSLKYRRARGAGKVDETENYPCHKEDIGKLGSPARPHIEETANHTRNGRFSNKGLP